MWNEPHQSRKFCTRHQRMPENIGLQKTRQPNAAYKPRQRSQTIDNRRPAMQAIELEAIIDNQHELAGSQAPALVVIYKYGQAGKAVISAGMPKSRPWTVTSRLCKCLIQVTCQPVVSWTWMQGHLSWPIVCHPWTLDFGIHAEMTGFGQLVYNDEISSLGTS